MNDLLKQLIGRLPGGATNPYLVAAGLVGMAVYEATQGNADHACTCVLVALSALGVQLRAGGQPAAPTPPATPAVDTRDRTDVPTFTVADTVHTKLPAVLVALLLLAGGPAIAAEPAAAVDLVVSGAAGPAAELVVSYEGASYEAPGFHMHGPPGELPAEVNGDGRPWPVKRLPYWIDWRGLGSVTAAQRAGVRSAFREAWGYWAAVADIQPVEVATEREALVYHRFGRIDGALGTLAWSYLADGTLRPKEQKYDTGEQWNTGPPTAGRLSLPIVAAHEIGHVLGLGHDGQDADALMRPSYSAAIPRPRPRDVNRLFRLGYDRRR